MKTFSGILAVVLFVQINVYAQHMYQPVSMQLSQVPLKEVLALLSKQYKLKFTYGNSQAALEKELSLAVKGLPLHQFLSMVLRKAGLTYKKVGVYIVLRPLAQGKKEPDPLVKNERGFGKETGGSQQVPDSSLEQEVMELPQLSRIGWQEPESLQGLLQISPVKKFETEAAAGGQRRTRVFKISPLFSLDVMQLSYKSNFDSRQQLSSGFNYSLGWAAQRDISERLGVEIQLLYRVKDFAIHYLLEMEDEPLGLPERTELDLSYMELPLGVNFQLLRYRDIALSGTAGFFGSWLLEKEERTWLDDGRLFNTTAMYGNTLSSFLWGMRASFRIAIRLNDNFAFSIAPACQYTINKLKKGAQQISLQEITLRTGLCFLL